MGGGGHTVNYSVPTHMHAATKGKARLIAAVVDSPKLPDMSREPLVDAVDVDPEAQES